MMKKNNVKIKAFNARGARDDDSDSEEDSD